LRVYNRYVLFLVLISCFVNTLLAFFGQEDLSIYLIVNIICFLVLSLIFMPSNPKAKKTFNTLNMIYFTGFLVIVIIEFINVISDT
jgi:hypothetical protein